MTATETRGPGDNSGDPAAAIFEQFRTQLALWLQGLDKVKEAGAVTAANADKRRDFYAGIKKFRGKADEARRAEKEPFLLQGREVDARWKAIIDQAAAVESAISEMLLAHAKEEKAKADAAAAEARARQQKAEQEAAAAKRAEALATKESERIAAASRAAEAEAAAESAKQAAALMPKVAIGSATGAATKLGLRDVRHAVIVAPARAMMHYRDHPKMIALLQQLADEEIRASKGEPVEIPGVEIRTETKLSQ